MSAKDYNKADLENLGGCLENLLVGCKNGVGTEEFTNLTQTFVAAASTVNEMKDVPSAAIPHTLGYVALKYGDRELAEAIAAEAGEE